MRAKVLLSAVTLLLGTAALTPSPAEASGWTWGMSSNTIAFGTVTVGSTSLQSVTVQNTGGSPISVRPDEPATEPTAPFAVDPQTAPGSPRPDSCWWYDGGGAVQSPNLDPGAACRLYYRFAPTTATASSGASHVTVYDMIGSPLGHETIALSGTGQAAATGTPATSGSFTVTPTSAAFGNVEVGTTKQLTLSVRNTSNGNVQVRTTWPTGAIFAAAEQPGDCVVGTTARVLAPQATCTVHPAFTPSALGAKSGNLALKLSPSSAVAGQSVAYGSTAVLASKTVAMSGTGVKPPVSSDPTKLAFGSVTVTGSKSIVARITNNSSKTLEFAPTYPANGPFHTNPYAGMGLDDCLSPQGGWFRAVAPGGSCDLWVEFAPSAAGAKSGTISVAARLPNAGATLSTLSIAVSGTGLAATATISPASLAFGTMTQTDGKVLTTTVTNTSTVPMTYDVVFPDGSLFGYQQYDNAMFNPEGCSHPDGTKKTVDPGQTCVIRVYFDAATTGSKSASIKLNGYGPPPCGGPGFCFDPPLLLTKTIAATATVATATATLDPGSLAFGDVTVTGTKSMSTTVTNTSTVPMNFRIVFPDGSPYGFSPYDQMVNMDGCSHPDGSVKRVDPGQTCRVLVELTASTVGAKSATLKLQGYALAQCPAPGFCFDPVLLVTKNIAASATVVAPTATLQPASLSFGNVTRTGSKELRTVVTNTSTITMTFDATIPDGTAFGPGAQLLPGMDNADCEPQGAGPVYVQPGASCEVRVQFHPGELGNRTAAIKIEGHYLLCGAGFCLDGGVAVTKTLNVSGTGVAATFTLSPTSLAFGTVKVGSGKVLTTVVKNTSTTPFILSPTYPAGSGLQTWDPGAFVASDCVQQGQLRLVYPGDSCNLRVYYRPPAVAASKTYTIKVDVRNYSQFGFGEVIGTKNLTASGAGGA